MAGTLYNSGFQDQHLAGSLASAAVVLPILFRSIRPASIIDVGCGLGSWLKTAGDLGVHSVLGLDGDHFDRAKLLIDPNDFQVADLGERISIGTLHTTQRRFDLAISVEVAEHLSYSRSESFVSDLTALSDVILFSAATPYQGGTNHINEQWLEFWGILFRRFSYVACDVLRPRVWGDPNVEFWYRQNLMIFCKAEIAGALFPEDGLHANRALSFVHPLSLMINAARYRPLLPEARELECHDYTALTRAYLAGDVTLPPLKTPEAMAADRTRLFPEARMRVRDASADIAAARCEAISLGTELERLRPELENRRRDIETLNRQSAACHGEVGRLGAESERLLRELEAGRRDIEILNRHLGIRDSVIGGYQNEIACLRNDADRRARELEDAGQHIDGLEKQLGRRDADAATYRSGIASLETDIKRLVHELKDEHCQKERLHKELAIRDARVGRLNSETALETARMNGCIARLQARVDQMKIALDARNYEVLANRRTALWRILARLRALPAMFSRRARNHRDVGLVTISGLFDRCYYVSQSPPMEMSGLDPVRHYVERGAAEGRDPNRFFDTSFYLAANPDVLRSRMNPLAHYHEYGAAEGRDPHPSFNTSAYLARNPGFPRTGMTPLLHYLVSDRDVLSGNADQVFRLPNASALTE